MSRFGPADVLAIIDIRLWLTHILPCFADSGKQRRSPEAVTNDQNLPASFDNRLIGRYPQPLVNPEVRYQVGQLSTLGQVNGGLVPFRIGRQTIPQDGKELKVYLRLCLHPFLASNPSMSFINWTAVSPTSGAFRWVSSSTTSTRAAT